MENSNRMAFLVCENEDAASVHMTSERLWDNIYRCGDTDLNETQTRKASTALNLMKKKQNHYQINKK